MREDVLYLLQKNSIHGTNMKDQSETEIFYGLSSALTLRNWNKTLLLVIMGIL
jgi:hypothetical protein